MVCHKWVSTIGTYAILHGLHRLTVLEILHNVHTLIMASSKEVSHELTETGDARFGRPFAWELSISGSAEVEVLLVKVRNQCHFLSPKDKEADLLILQILRHLPIFIYHVQLRRFLGANITPSSLRIGIAFIGSHFLIGNLRNLSLCKYKIRYHRALFIFYRFLYLGEEGQGAAYPFIALTDDLCRDLMN